MDDIATRQSFPSEVDLVSVIARDTEDGAVTWAPHANGGWVGHYFKEPSMIERLTDAGYFWAREQPDDTAGHVPTSYYPDDFADLYAAIIASYNG
jgi:hypothetical protein